MLYRSISCCSIDSSAVGSFRDEAAPANAVIVSLSRDSFDALCLNLSLSVLCGAHLIKQRYLLLLLAKMPSV